MNRKSAFMTSLISLLMVCPSHALDILGRAENEGGRGVKDGLVALYRFSPSYGGRNLTAYQVADESGVLPALDLTASNTSGSTIIRKCDRTFYDSRTNRSVPMCYMDFDGNDFHRLRSGVATKIAQQCKATNQLTIEMFVRNDRDDELTKEGRMVPLKLITMGRETPVASTSTSRYLGSSNDYNFYFGLDYDAAAQYAGSVRIGNRTQRNATADDGFTSSSTSFNNQQIARYAVQTSESSINSGDSTTSKILVKDQIQHIVYTISNTGSSKLYVSAATNGTGANEDPFSILPILRSEVNRTDTNPFAGWNDQFILSIGNEATSGDANAPVAREGSNTSYTTEERPWRGEIYLLAIYCNEHTEDEILGDLAPDPTLKSYAFNPNVTPDDNHVRAAQLYSRITGIRIPITAPIISGVNDPDHPEENYQGNGMVQYIQRGDWYGAAKLATNQDSFYNITVRDFAKRMSTRDETVNTPLNDFVATIIGVTRDDIPATQLLTGNFLYIGDPQKTAAPSNIQNDMLLTNNHYERLESRNYNLRQVLKKTDRQYASNGTAAVEHPDPAGVLTSRAFLSAHALAGTNRRIVEYAFREFMCIPMSGWAFANGENRVGPDVDRFPGGDHNKFLSNCRSCHSNMDSLRGAFAKYHFNNNFVKHGDVVVTPANSEMNETATTMCRSNSGVACKMNRNSDVYEQGYISTDDSFVRPEFTGSNALYFGWTTGTSGNGARGFGQMMATSKAFPDCMAKRVFRAVCKRDPAEADSAAIQAAATAFVTDNYNLENLFARIAVRKECLGEEVGN